MSRVIILDAGPLGLVTNPKLSPASVACAQWLQTQITLGNRAIIPEISDYEVRRELLRAGKTKGLARLNDLANLIEYLPLTTAAMRQAAKSDFCVRYTWITQSDNSLKTLVAILPTTLAACLCTSLNEVPITW